MRKWLVSVIVLVLVLGLGLAEARTTITMWHTWGAGTQRDKVVRTIVEAFEKAHPDIKVDVVPNTGANSAEARQKYMVAAAAGVPPDVAILGGLDLEWIENGLIQPLTSFFKRDGLDKNYFFPGTWEAMSYNGDQWAPPVSLELTTQMMAINIDMFSEAGLDANQPPETVYDLETANRKLTIIDDSGKIKRVGMFPFSIYGEWNAFNQWAARFGAVFAVETPNGPRWNINTPETRAALNWLNNWYQNVGHGNYQSTDVYRMRNNTSAQLAYGASAMVLWLNGYNQGMTNYERPVNYRVVWLPYHPSINKTDGIRVSGGFGLTMSAATKYPEAAWEFIKFWIQSDEVAMIWGVDMGELTIKRNNPYMRVMLENREHYGTFVEYTAFAQGPLPSVPGYSVLTSTTTSLLQQVYQGRMSPAVALETIQERMDAEVEAYYK